MAKRDFLDFIMFCGMYANGATTSYVDDQTGRRVVVTRDADGNFTVNGMPIAQADLEKITKGKEMGMFHPL